MKESFSTGDADLCRRILYRSLCPKTSWSFISESSLHYCKMYMRTFLLYSVKTYCVVCTLKCTLWVKRHDDNLACEKGWCKTG